VLTRDYSGILLRVAFACLIMYNLQHEQRRWSEMFKPFSSVMLQQPGFVLLPGSVKRKPAGSQNVFNRPGKSLSAGNDITGLAPCLMNQEQYEIRSADDLSVFGFTSTGRNGDIIKLVQFRQIQTDVSANRYNLGLGDWVDDHVDGETITNNGDIKKVMATIGRIVLFYTTKFPEREIFASGSTRHRSRLYQMLVSNNLEEIERDFEVFGIRYRDNVSNELEGVAEKFKKNKTYGAILVTRK
jgi:hypothetical protein